MEETELVYSTDNPKHKKKYECKYSLSLTENEWQQIIALMWLEHNFKFAEKLKRKLKDKYPEIILS